MTLREYMIAVHSKATASHRLQASTKKDIALCDEGMTKCKQAIREIKALRKRHGF